MRQTDDQVQREAQLAEEAIWKERTIQDGLDRELGEICTLLNEQLSQLKLVHNFRCEVSDDASYRYADRYNRMLDMTTDNIDLDERIDFLSSIKPLLDERKYAFFDKIKLLQTEFK